MTAYFVGDVPAEDLVIEPARGGLAIDLGLFSSVTVTFRDPAGEPVLSAGFLATIDVETIVVEWPAETVLETPGVYTLTLTLEGLGDVSETLSPIRIVVEAIASAWYSLDLARDDWPDAPSSTDFEGAGDYVLWELLETAKLQVAAYAPALAVDVRPPFNYRKGQLMHARTIWNAGRADATGQVGLEGFIVTPKALERDTRDVLRPKNPVPVIG